MPSLSLLFFRDCIVSVYLEVRDTYIDDNRKFVPNDGSYVERRKLNSSERKKLRGIMTLLEEKGRLRNVPFSPQEIANFSIVFMVMRNRVRFLQLQYRD